MLSHPGVDMDVLIKSLEDQLDLPLGASKEMKTETALAFSLQSAGSSGDEASINTSKSLFGQQVLWIVCCLVCSCFQLTLNEINALDGMEI